MWFRTLVTHFSPVQSQWWFSNLIRRHKPWRGMGTALDFPFLFFFKEGNNHKGHTKLEVCEYKIRRFWGGWARSPLWKPLIQSGLDFQFPRRPTFTLRETFLSTFYISLCFIWLPKFLSSQGINTFLMFIFLSLTVSILKIKNPF